MLSFGIILFHSFVQVSFPFEDEGSFLLEQSFTDVLELRSRSLEYLDGILGGRDFLAEVSSNGMY